MIEPAICTHGARMFKAEETANKNTLRQKHKGPLKRKGMRYYD